MVQTLINLDDRRDRIVNIVKGKYGLKNKTEAVSTIIDHYEKTLLEPHLRPEYIKDLQQIQKGKYHRIGSVDSLRKELDHEQNRSKR
jgi:hypothetical protein